MHKLNWEEFETSSRNMELNLGVFKMPITKLRRFSNAFETPATKLRSCKYDTD